MMQFVLNIHSYKIWDICIFTEDRILNEHNFLHILAVLPICKYKSQSNLFLVHPPINLWSDTNLLVFYEHDKDKGITFVCSRIVSGFWLIFYICVTLFMFVFVSVYWLVCADNDLGQEHTKYHIFSLCMQTAF